MAATHLDVGLRCVKYLLCAVNSLFVLTGVMIISIGSTIFAVYEDFSSFLDPSYFSPASLLVGVGILIFVIAFFGCWGAFKESTCMVLVFAVSLSIVLILELAAAIAAYALQDGIKDLLASKINATMQEYRTNEEAVAAVDFMQSRLHCCGYNNYEDWSIIPIKFEGEIYFPESCCAWISHEANQTSCTPFQEGCLSRLSIIVHRSALYIGTGAIAIALIQLTGIMFACVLGKAIRRQKTQRELRRWELRQSLVNGYQPLEKTMSFPVTCVQSPEYPLKGI